MHWVKTFPKHIGTPRLHLPSQPHTQSQIHAQTHIPPLTHPSKIHPNPRKLPLAAYSYRHRKIHRTHTLSVASMSTPLSSSSFATSADRAWWSAVLPFCIYGICTRQECRTEIAQARTYLHSVYILNQQHKIYPTFRSHEHTYTPTHVQSNTQTHINT